MPWKHDKALLVADTNWLGGTSGKVIKFKDTTLVSSDIRDDEALTRWPLWKSALLVISFCGSFWIGFIMLVLRFLG